MQPAVDCFQAVVPNFLALGTGFMEDNIFLWIVEGDYFGDDSMGHIYCNFISISVAILTQK